MGVCLLDTLCLQFALKHHIFLAQIVAAKGFGRNFVWFPIVYGPRDYAASEV